MYLPYKANTCTLVSYASSAMWITKEIKMGKKNGKAVQTKIKFVDLTGPGHGTTTSYTMLCRISFQFALAPCFFIRSYSIFIFRACVCVCAWASGSFSSCFKVISTWAKYTIRNAGIFLSHERTTQKENKYIRYYFMYNKAFIIL